MNYEIPKRQTRESILCQISEFDYRDSKDSRRSPESLIEEIQDAMKKASDQGYEKLWIRFVNYTDKNGDVSSTNLQLVGFKLESDNQYIDRLKSELDQLRQYRKEVIDHAFLANDETWHKQY